jgi:hypothetical protein
MENMIVVVVIVGGGYMGVQSVRMVLNPDELARL